MRPDPIVACLSAQEAYLALGTFNQIPGGLHSISNKIKRFGFFPMIKYMCKIQLRLFAVIETML